MSVPVRNQAVRVVHVMSVVYNPRAPHTAAVNAQLHLPHMLLHPGTGLASLPPPPAGHNLWYRKVLVGLPVPFLCLPPSQVLLAHYPGEAQAAAFLDRLGAHSRLQFDFLTAALRARQEIQQVRPCPGVPCLSPTVAAVLHYVLGRRRVSERRDV